MSKNIIKNEKRRQPRPSGAVMTEVIEWNHADTPLDEGVSVLVDVGCGDVCRGFKDEGEWCWDIDGSRITEPVLYWAHVPAGPSQTSNAGGGR